MKVYLFSTTTFDGVDAHPRLLSVLQRCSGCFETFRASEKPTKSQAFSGSMIALLCFALFVPDVWHDHPIDDDVLLAHPDRAIRPLSDGAHLRGRQQQG